MHEKTWNRCSRDYRKLVPYVVVGMRWDATFHGQMLRCNSSSGNLMLVSIRCRPTFSLRRDDNTVLLLSSLLVAVYGRLLEVRCYSRNGIELAAAAAASETGADPHQSPMLWQQLQAQLIALWTCRRHEWLQRMCRRITRFLGSSLIPNLIVFYWFEF